jgi:hypothetical protein
VGRMPMTWRVASNIWVRKRTTKIIYIFILR